MDTWHVYLLRTRTGSLYTGIAKDVVRRVAEHADGTKRGARSLRGKAPLALVFEREIGSRGLAQRVEARIKGLSRERKEALVRDAPDAGELMERLSLPATDRTSRSRVRSHDGRRDRTPPDPA